MAVTVSGRRLAHGARRASVHARHESAFCRRMAIQNARFFAANAHHTQAWWRRFWSPRQVAKRARLARIAARQRAARIRREKKFMAKAGRKFIHFQACPSRVSMAARRAAQKRQAATAKFFACVRAQSPQSASTATRAAQSLKSAKSRKATAGANRRRKGHC